LWEILTSLEDILLEIGGWETSMICWGFNASINNLRLEELKLYGNHYTWSNNQESQLDSFFSSISWVASYPGSKVTTLSGDISDHYSCRVSISTNIPKAKIFRFENFWMLHDDFSQVLQHGWSMPTFQTDDARILTAKLKNLRRVFRRWQANLANIAKTTGNNKMILRLTDLLEEFRDLSLKEWNFRQILKEH
jgi:hypothetical protein